MFERKETKLIVENWRNFLKEENEKSDNKKLLKEIDISSIYSLATDAIQAYGPIVATAGGMIAGSHVVKIAYDKIVNELMTKNKNREAFLKFLDLLQTYYENSDIRDKWSEWIKGLTPSDVDMWILSGKKLLNRTMKPKHKSYRLNKDLEQKVDVNRLKGFTKKIHSLLNYWNPSKASSSFNKKIVNTMDGSSEDLDIIIEILNQSYHDYNNGFPFDNIESYYIDNAQTCSLCDILFETMLIYFKVNFSKQAEETKEAISVIQEKFGNQFTEEIDENGGTIIKLKDNADVECMYALADSVIKNESESLSTGSSSMILNVKPPNFDFNNPIFKEYRKRKKITGSRIQKLQKLKSFLLLVKKFVLTSATGGMYAFLQAFATEFVQDEILGEVSEIVKEKIDSKEIDDSSDMGKQEFAKFIISILLE